MAMLEPRLAILDETDSGLDIDALRMVAEGVNALRAPERAHDRDHALPAPARLHRAGPGPRAGDGRIVRSGGKELAQELEQHGLRRGCRAPSGGRAGGGLTDGGGATHERPGLRPAFGEAGRAAGRRGRARCAERPSSASRRRASRRPRVEAWKYTNVASSRTCRWGWRRRPRSGSTTSSAAARRARGAAADLRQRPRRAGAVALREPAGRRAGHEPGPGAARDAGALRARCWPTPRTTARSPRSTPPSRADGAWIELADGGGAGRAGPARLRRRRASRRRR